MAVKLGLDIGSTTIKAAAINERGELIYKKYERHLSKITEKAAEILADAAKHLGENTMIAISGSAGMGLAEFLGVPFVQEVYSTKLALEKRLGNADVAIELGGEDAKILFLSGGLEVRMNGTCAGGTGAFIDQMATLLGVSSDELDCLAADAQKIYPIASRCGVFAKTDIQPLMNQGARKEDLSKSILYAIVNQCIGGLAQGRKICGKVVYLGGPLTFFSQLRDCFDRSLGLTGLCPPDSLYFVAMGAAYFAQSTFDLTQLALKAEEYGKIKKFNTLKPLFASRDEYETFIKEHACDKVDTADAANYSGEAYIGIDSGSTTVKCVVIDENDAILDSAYLPNKGNAVELMRDYIANLYARFPSLNLAGGASTGYGEELIKNAFALGGGIVETFAHYIAAKKLMPDVEFVIDIGGQDMKCFKIKNGAIDDIFLNEACSSGCGSFLQTVAGTLGYNAAEFARLGMFAPNPVDLGSRCTVFMNSAIKQAQKDGASVENISAGLAVSVIKNALYKVIRVKDVASLGKKIVVQGGTFLNDAVLRAFEQELGVKAVRPDIAGLMGAYGAAIYARRNKMKGVISREEIEDFSCEVKNARCGLCGNNCQLTIHDFHGRKYVGGNKCERPTGNKRGAEGLNIFDYKLKKLSEYKSDPVNEKTVGLPLGLNFYELLPFWHTFFKSLGLNVRVTPFADGKTMQAGQTTIPSDTVCFPAKLMHGQIKKLLDDGVKRIFYPCMSYNVDERLSNNRYNCPVVAYYPEVINHSIEELRDADFIFPFVDIQNKRKFVEKLLPVLKRHFPEVTKKDVARAAKSAYAELAKFRSDVKNEGERIMNEAEKRGLPIIALCGRPYHADPEINHGIPRLISDMGCAVVSEDSLPYITPTTSVLNQWTYHARLYSAAEFAVSHKNVQIVQTVSFGCGLDAITADEMRRILEEGGKLYTQLKIDEITNTGAIKIRLKSLMAALRYNEGL